jgi:alkaline phosphatase D
VEVAGLEPGREYWYRFRAGNEISQTGRTKTAPAAGVAVDQLRFGVCGCSHYETGYFTGYRRIAQEQFDFVIHTGDYIYESRADGGRNENRVRQHQGDEIFTLVDYRNRYAQYKTDPDLMAAHRTAPFVVSWDDHEVENNYAGELDENGTPAPIFLLRRAAAYQAYYEHMPLRVGAGRCCRSRSTRSRATSCKRTRTPVSTWTPGTAIRPHASGCTRGSRKRRRPTRS